MKNLFTALVLTIITSIAYADEYKSFWRCSDGHLEALEPTAGFDGQKIDVFISYILPGDRLLQSVPVGLTSMVNLPATFKHGDYLMLGTSKQGLVNCAGEIIINPNYHQGKVVFDVRKNASGCPFAPKDCALAKAQ
jgi:hypothetical protein